MELVLPRCLSHVIACISVALLAACGGGDDGDGTATGSAGAVASVRIDPAVGSLAVGETATFRAEALDAAGNVLSGKNFSFSSSSPSVATVAIPIANPASVTAVANGTTLINATTEGKTGTANLTVGGQPDFRVNGRVVDGQTNMGLGGVQVEYSTNDVSNATTTTGADGSYSFTFRSGHVSTTLTATLSGYATGLLSAQISASTNTLAPILLVRAGGPSTISGRLLNARTREPITGVELFAVAGQVSSQLGVIPFGGLGQATYATANAQGEYSFANLPAGAYTVGATAPGFAACDRTAVSVGPPAVANQDVFCSPMGTRSDEFRVVLTWGRDPADLDSHLTGPVALDQRFHIFYSSRGFSDPNAPVAPFARLDTDNTASFGPETITVTQMNSGIYRYSVHDYTNRGSASSTALGSSGAKVELYSGDGAKTFFVPSQPGNVWTVFELTPAAGGTGRPTLNVINSMSVQDTPADIL